MSGFLDFRIHTETAMLLQDQTEKRIVLNSGLNQWLEVEYNDVFNKHSSKTDKQTFYFCMDKFFVIFIVDCMWS